MSENIASSDEEVQDWRAFLTDRPPGTRAQVARAAHAYPSAPFSAVVDTPELQLYCDGACQRISHCKGRLSASGKLFGSIEAQQFGVNVPQPGPMNLPYDAIFSYACERCQRIVKSYSVRFWSIATCAEGPSYANVEKIAECPPFSPRTPGKVMSLIGPDRDLFLKGRRAEIEGLGVGAFAYYRRIIEQQKNRLLDEIIRVARHIHAPADAVARLESAKEETQFSKAVESVKEAIPGVLYIRGHNPFTLLHSALSEGLHNGSDEGCLTAANDIRLILIEFADRLLEAMKVKKELDDALSRLVNRKRD
jgi:hypothetical protein